MITLKCQLCDEEFNTYRFTKKQRKFCSPKCYHQSLINRANLDQYRNKKCLHCKIDFISTQSGKNNILANKYCSKKCRRLYQSIIQKTGVYKKCLKCKKVFYVKKCNNIYKFCSTHCACKYRTGKYNPNLSISRSKLIAEGKINPKRNFYKQGWYVTKTGNKEWFGSSYEEKRMKQLDDMGVKWTKNHGIRIPYTDNNGRKRNYVPDFLINDKIIEEVKPKSVINTNFNNCKIKIPFAKKYCKNNGYEFRIITEKELNI